MAVCSFQNVVCVRFRKDQRFKLPSGSIAWQDRYLMEALRQMLIEEKIFPVANPEPGNRTDPIVGFYTTTEADKIRAWLKITPVERIYKRAKEIYRRADEENRKSFALLKY